MITQYILDGIWILRGSMIKGIMTYLIILGIFYLTNKRIIFKIRQVMFESMLTMYDSNIKYNRNNRNVILFFRCDEWHV